MKYLDHVVKYWKFYAVGAAILFVLLGWTFGEVPQWPGQ